MAATPVTVNTITETGIAPVTPVAADNTNGNSLTNGPTVFLELTNGGGSSATVSVAFASTVDGQTIPPKQYTLAAAAKLYVGPFPTEYYGQSLKVTASAATVTIAAYQVA